jgi:hypothetical protein
MRDHRIYHDFGNNCAGEMRKMRSNQIAFSGEFFPGGAIFPGNV